MTNPSDIAGLVERLRAKLRCGSSLPWRHEQIHRGGELLRDEILSDDGVIADEIRDPLDADLIVAAVNALPGLLDLIEKLVAERDEVRFAPIGDNHHNAAACPHCRPTMEADRQALEAAQAKVGQIEAAVRDATRSFCDCDGYVVASEVNARLDKALAEGGSNG